MDIAWLALVGICSIVLAVIVFISFGPEPEAEESESKSEKDSEIIVNEYTAGGTA